MVNLLESLYALTALAAIIAVVAAVQTRGAGPDRVEHYRRRMRRAALLSLVLALLAAGLYWYLSVD